MAKPNILTFSTKKSKETILINEKAGHTKYRLFKGRVLQLVIMSVFLSILFSLWIFRYLVLKQTGWIPLAVPISFVGLLTIFIGPTEEWDYAPWQSQAQQVEKTFFD